jgi:hypothetical protein
MQPTALLAAALFVVGLVGPAAAEERYQLQKTEGGYVRLNTETGEMSICEEKANQLVCRAAAEERTAFQDELDRLQARLDGLEERLARLEARPAVPEALLPSDEEIDKSMDVMEKFFRRFMGIMKDIQKDDSGAQRT